MKEHNYELYKQNTANFPRLNSDVYFADYNNDYNYNNFIDENMRFVESKQLLISELWNRFVYQFCQDSDYDGGWRGEYWGKMMRGACFVYSYTKNNKLYELLKKAVADMINAADKYGRISSYGVEHEFEAWDLWCRKYVLLGMQYFIEICDDENFVKQIIDSMQSQVNYIIDKIGNFEDGKKPITSATRSWRGLNSSSILEPVVRLYSITNNKKYLEFAEYIVENGGTDVVNVFELAYENNLYPYQYPVTKAYELTSCFEGLLEYYRITGNEKYKTAIINYANRILESDFTVIGSSGCTHELFDHSTVRQSNTNNGIIQQETCVTVTLMKFFYQLTLLTGEAKYADAFEISLYNAYLGAINTEGVIDSVIHKEYPDAHIEALPFDSYSPLTASKRGNGIGGLKLMSDGHYYGCCACIGSAGIGLVPKMQLMSSEKGFVLNLYINGSIRTKTPLGTNVLFDIQTDYPKNGKVIIKVHSDKDESFDILIRVPHWSKTTNISINNIDIETKQGYVLLNKIWGNNDIIELDFDMRTEAIQPISYNSQILMNIWNEKYDYVLPYFDKEDPKSKKHIALRRGPIMLAQDSRLGYSLDDAANISINSDRFVDSELINENKIPFKSIIAVEVPLKSGDKMLLTDYGSSGKLWNDTSKTAVWILNE